MRLRFSAWANGARGLMTANTMSVGFLVFEDIADELARDKARERIEPQDHILQQGQKLLLNFKSRRTVTWYRFVSRGIGMTYPVFGP